MWVTQFPSLGGWPVPTADLVTASSGTAKRRRERRLRARPRHERLPTYMAVSESVFLCRNTEEKKEKEEEAFDEAVLSLVKRKTIAPSAQELETMKLSNAQRGEEEAHFSLGLLSRTWVFSLCCLAALCYFVLSSPLTHWRLGVIRVDGSRWNVGAQVVAGVEAE